MKKYLIGFIAALILVVGMPAAAQNVTPESPLLQMLRFVPDTDNNRAWLSYGDMAMWHKSWNVPRVSSFDGLKDLTPDQRADWMYIAASQTDVPQTLGLNYVAVDDLRGFYGFDIFTVDRFMQAGNPPDGITVVDFAFDQANIANTLTASGYEAQPLESGATLYSILDDYGLDMSMKTVKTRTGQLGALNRIALLGTRLVIGRATDPVTLALSANSGASASLADDPSYVAAVQSLDDPALADTGDLVGLILIDHSQLDQEQQITSLSPDAAAQIMQGYKATPLPQYNLAAFATRHGNGATHFILAVVFPSGVDVESSANILADRMKNYISLRTNQPLTDRWTFELSAGTEIGGLPTALVSMKVDDPAPMRDDKTVPGAGLFSWSPMLAARDTLFLISQP